MRIMLQVWPAQNLREGRDILIVREVEIATSSRAYRSTEFFSTTYVHNTIVLITLCMFAKWRLNAFIAIYATIIISLSNKLHLNIPILGQIV